MTQERLAELKARMAKPVPEPYSAMIKELIDAVEGKARHASKPVIKNQKLQMQAVENDQDTEAINA